MAINGDIATTLAALSARIIALEGAVAALAPRDEQSRQVVLTRYNAFSREALDRHVALPVDEAFLECLRQSVDDMRSLLASTP